MNVYRIVLFTHVIGAMSLVAAHTTALVCMMRIRRASRVEHVRELAVILRAVAVVFPISLVVIVAAGLYMAGTVWGFTTGWIDVALGTFVLMIALVPRIVGARTGRISQAIRDAADGPLPESLSARIHDPVLAIGEHSVTTVTLGMVFLMTVKPELDLALAAIGVAIALGLMLGAPAIFAARKRRRRMARVESAVAQR